MAIRFAKMDGNLDSHPKIRRAGRNGREVFLFLLRRNSLLDRSGRIPVSYVDPWFLADQLQMTEAEAEEGLSRSVTAGLVTIRDGHAEIVGWDDEWAKRPLDEAERKAKQRGKEPAAPRLPAGPTAPLMITDGCDGESRNVTNDIVTDRDCPDSHTSEKSRSEERREEARPPAALVLVQNQAPTPQSRRGKSKNQPSGHETAIAKRVLAKLGARNGTEYSSAKDHVELIAARIREGRTELELDAVAALLDERWRDKPEMRHYLRPETLWGPKKIQSYLDEARTKFRRQLDTGQPIPTGGNAHRIRSPTPDEEPWLGGSPDAEVAS